MTASPTASGGWKQKPVRAKMPPALAMALRDHEERKRAEVARKYRAFLEQCLEERQRMLAESAEPISGTEEYRDWRQRVEAALAAVELDADGSPLAKDVRNAIDRDEKAARAWVRLAGARGGGETRRPASAVHARPCPADGADRRTGSRLPCRPRPGALRESRA